MLIGKYSLLHLLLFGIDLVRTLKFHLLTAISHEDNYVPLQQMFLQTYSR